MMIQGDQKTHKDMEDEARTDMFVSTGAYSAMLAVAWAVFQTSTKKSQVKLERKLCLADRTVVWSHMITQMAARADAKVLNPHAARIAAANAFRPRMVKEEDLAELIVTQDAGKPTNSSNVSKGGRRGKSSTGAALKGESLQEGPQPGEYSSLAMQGKIAGFKKELEVLQH